MPPFNLLSDWASSFSAKRSGAQSDTGTTTDRSVTDPQRIAHLLSRMVERNSLLTVLLPDSNVPYNSAILRTETTAEGYLLLDELTPAAGHHKLKVDSELKISGRLDGVEFAFHTVIVGIDQSGGIAFYKTPLPEWMFYNQRRSHYRARVSGARPVPVYLSRPDGHLSTADLRDISLGGLRARLKRVADISVARGSHITHCAVDLPKQGKIACALEVVHVHNSESRGVVTFGGRFVDLSKEHQSAIQRFIAGLERDTMKSRPGI